MITIDDQMHDQQAEKSAITSPKINNNNQYQFQHRKALRSNVSLGNWISEHAPFKSIIESHDQVINKFNEQLSASIKLPSNRSDGSSSEMRIMESRLCDQNPKSQCQNPNYDNNLKLLTIQRSNRNIWGPTGTVRGFRDLVKQNKNSLEQLASCSTRSFNESQNLSPLIKFLQQDQDQENNNNDNDRNPIGDNQDPKCTNGNEGLQKKRQTLRALYLEKLLNCERDSCVLYTTSLSVIRRTFDDSRVMRNILTLNLINFEERDVYLNREYKLQLRLRLQAMEPRSADDDKNNDNNDNNYTKIPYNNFRLPCLFLDGRLFCGLKELELLNESSELCKVFAKFKMSRMSSQVCPCCGNARFIACPNCNGSRRSSVHHFRFNSVALRCTRCDNNDGLVACPKCCL